jgi:hypothetical protein
METSIKPAPMGMNHYIGSLYNELADVRASLDRLGALNAAIESEAIPISLEREPYDKPEGIIPALESLTLIVKDLKTQLNRELDALDTFIG